MLVLYSELLKSSNLAYSPRKLSRCDQLASVAEISGFGVGVIQMKFKLITLLTRIVGGIKVKRQ